MPPCTAAISQPNLVSEDSWELTFALVLSKWSKLSECQIKAKNKGLELWNTFALACIHVPTSLQHARTWASLEGRGGCSPSSIQYLQYGAGKVIKSIKGIRAVYSTFLSICCPINMICSWENNTPLRQRQIEPQNCETKERGNDVYKSYCKQMHFKRNSVTDSVSQCPPTSFWPLETLLQPLLGVSPLAWCFRM
jgi:hypothetical protein